MVSCFWLGESSSQKTRDRFEMQNLRAGGTVNRDEIRL